MTKKIIFIACIFLVSCKDKVEKTIPTLESISESIYASGLVKSKNQYQAYAPVSGIIEKVFVSEGDTVKKGSPILFISNETQKLSKENAELLVDFSDIKANQGKLKEAALFIELSENKLKNDSALYFRQKALWEQQIGTKVELEQSQLVYENSKVSHYSAVVKYDDLKRQLGFNSSQSKKNLLISSTLERDFTLRSEIDGMIYNLYKEKGEIVNMQTALAVIGDSKNFTLEMQVDEYDIIMIRKGLLVLITMDSYKGKVFEAKVTKINPLMNERSKTFLVEAEFIKQPDVLYPNISFEANIVLKTKDKVLLIPRSFLIRDSLVVKSDGDTVVVKTGIRDYRKIEILSGIDQKDELIKALK